MTTQKKCNFFLFMLLGISFCLSACDEEQTIQVPVSSCTTQYTGKTRTDTVMNYMCTSYDKNGACVVQVPIYQEYHSSEVAYSCKFNKWE